jgi:hypothetical protein
VYDMLGNVVATQNTQLLNGKASLFFDVNHLANGNYLVRYKNAIGKYDGVIKFTKTSKN